MFANERRPLPVLTPRLQRLFGQVVRFAISGGLAFALDAGILTGLVKLGVPALAARVVSISAAIVFTWLMNRRHTFAVQAAPTFREFAHYVAISLVGALINYTVFSGAVLLHAPLLIGLAAGTACGMVFNFVRYRALMDGR